MNVPWIDHKSLRASKYLITGVIACFVALGVFS
jgi:hypothetical protein